MQTRYLYCIIESKKDDTFGDIGIASSRRINSSSQVYTMSYKDLSAVVSNMFGPEPREVLREGITHQKVVEEVMKKYEVLPMRFGQVPKSQDEVKGFLSGCYDKLKELFRKIEGKVELGLKASWKMDMIMKEIVNSNDRIRILQKHISSLPEGKTYMLKIELGELVAQELKAHGEALAEEIFNSLKPLSVDAKTNKPLNDKMILNAAFLVPRDTERHFDETVNEIEKKHPELIMKYVLAPPYNFVNIGVLYAVNR